jgi:DNA-binding transcriptional ArsR family regulator
MKSASRRRLASENEDAMVVWHGSGAPRIMSSIHLDESRHFYQNIGRAEKLIAVSEYSDTIGVAVGHPRLSRPQSEAVMVDTKRKPAPAPKLTSLESLSQAAECLKTLAHPHRLRIVQMLLGGRYTVGELAEACEIPSHMASEHLRLMQRCGFLDVEKEGRCVYYTIVEPHLASIMSCIEARFGGPKSLRTTASA